MLVAASGRDAVFVFFFFFPPSSLTVQKTECPRGRQQAGQIGTGKWHLLFIAGSREQAASTLSAARDPPGRLAARRQSEDGMTPRRLLPSPASRQETTPPPGCEIRDTSNAACPRAAVRVNRFNHIVYWEN